jgi:cytochrome c oxidase assembly protein subunit 15
MTERGALSATQRTIHAGAWIALLLLILPFLLGALTTSFKVGMAVPDGATTFGQSLLTYDWRKSWWGVQLEHTHRLAGATLGFVMIALCLSIFFTEKRQFVRWLGMASLGLVIAQGMLGIIRVEDNARWGREWATFHGSFAQIVLATLVFLTAATSPWWILGDRVASPNARSIQRWTLALVVLTYVQIVVGALYRHQSRGFHIHATIGYALFLVYLYTAALVLLDPIARKRLGVVLGIAFAGVFAQIILGNASALVYGATPREFVTEITNLQAFTTAGHQLVGSVFFASTVALALASRRMLVQENVG